MASRRRLKKQISYIAGDLFLASLVEGVNREIIINATHNVLNLIPRISHTQPGNVKGYRLIDAEPTFYVVKIVIRFLVAYLRQFVVVPLEHLHCWWQYRGEEV